MKLLFPNGEHSQVLLSEGPNRIGSDPQNQVVVGHPDVVAQHCVIEVKGATATIAPVDGRVSINGNPVEGVTTVRPGDLLAIGSVQARAVGVERAQSGPARRPADVDDSGATRLRLAVPRFVLRGVSGAIFGKTYAVGREMVIGRQQDSDIPVPAEEISRHHAKVKPTPDGLMVEDLGSANGTYINDKRVQQGLLKPGDELRLDTIRFLLIAPGTEIPKSATIAPEAKAAPFNWKVLVPAAVAVALVVAGMVWWLMR